MLKILAEISFHKIKFAPASPTLIVHQIIVSPLFSSHDFFAHHKSTKERKFSSFFFFCLVHTEKGSPKGQCHVVMLSVRPITALAVSALFAIQIFCRFLSTYPTGWNCFGGIVSGIRCDQFFF